MSGSENLYIVDTSTLIELQRQYPSDIFPSVWRYVHELVISRRFIAPVEVKKELLEGYDLLLTWVNAHDSVFYDLDEELILTTQKVLQQFPRMADAESDKLHNADPFVVALAVLMREQPQQKLTKYRVCVVTNEKGKLSGNPLLHPANMKKIPDVCSQLGIISMDHFGMFREENWSF